MVASPNPVLVESWTLSLHAKAPGTTKLYRRTVETFAVFLAATGRPENAPGDLCAVSRQDIEAWFGVQRAAGLAPATIRSRWIALRNLYGWLADEEEIDGNPMSKVKVDRANSVPVDVLTDGAVAALLKACEGKAFLDRRDMALIRVLAATGMRRAELTALTVEDIDLVRRVAYIRHGKGDKARYVRFDAGTAAAIDRYRRTRARHRLAALPALWLSRSGPLQPNGVSWALDRRAELAGIGHVHPHQLRHTFAHRFLERGGNEGDLQRLGGWESAEVMRRYGSARAADRALAAYDDIDVMGRLR